MKERVIREDNVFFVLLLGMIVLVFVPVLLYVQRPGDLVNLLRENPVGWGLPFLWVGYGVLLLLRRRKFGRASLVLEGDPAPGGYLTGRVRARMDASLEEPVCLTLELVRKEYRTNWLTGRGETHEVTIWDVEQEVPPAQWRKNGGEWVEAPFRIDVPARVPGARGRLKWELSTHRALPGPDFYARFKIPMPDPEPEASGSD